MFGHESIHSFEYERDGQQVVAFASENFFLFIYCRKAENIYSNF